MTDVFFVVCIVCILSRRVVAALFMGAFAAM